MARTTGHTAAVDYEGNSDIYLSTPEPPFAAGDEKQPAGFGASLNWSPDGRYALIHRDKHWHLLDSATDPATDR
jgi:hypothetical protein